MHDIAAQIAALDGMNQTFEMFLLRLSERELIDRRQRATERQSLVVTTNLPFEQWTEVCGSERLTGAMLDRLTHRVHLGRGQRRELPLPRQSAADAGAAKVGRNIETAGPRYGQLTIDTPAGPG